MEKPVLDPDNLIIVCDEWEPEPEEREFDD